MKEAKTTDVKTTKTKLFRKKSEKTKADRTKILKRVRRLIFTVYTLFSIRATIPI